MARERKKLLAEGEQHMHPQDVLQQKGEREKKNDGQVEIMF
jgi:hypothetical protein